MIEPNGTSDAEEARRVQALRALAIMDTQPEAIFDRITELAALTLQAPIAFVSLIDTERQWFKSCIGVDLKETPRDIAFCDYTIRQDDVLVAPDCRIDLRFKDNPFVTQAPHVRFYAGAPLITDEGHRLGSLCIIDFEPRCDLSAAERTQLKKMAAAVTSAMTMRRDMADYIRMEQELRQADEKLRASAAELTFLTEHSADLILRQSPESGVTWVSQSCRQHGFEVEDLLGWKAFDYVHPDDRPKLEVRQAARLTGSPDASVLRGEYRIRGRDGGWVWMEENPSLIRNGAGQVVETISILRDINDRKRTEHAAADIQAGMLPPRCALARLSPLADVDAILKPASSIGGDFYDAFMIDPSRLCFVLGDVTGKGLPAALFMALSKALCHSLLLRASDLGEAVRAISAELARNNSEAMALSLVAGVPRLATRTSSSRARRWPPIEVSTTRASASRV